MTGKADRLMLCLCAALCLAVFGAPGRAGAQSTEKTAPTISTSHGLSADHVVFSPDGRWLATTGSDGTIKIWDFASGRVLRTIAGYTDHISDVRQLGITSDGKRLITNNGHDESIRVWNPETGVLVHTLKSQTRYFAISNQSILINDDFSHLQRWDIGSGQPLGAPLALNSEVLEGSFPGPVALSPDQQMIAVGYDKYFKRPLARIVLMSSGTGAQIKVLNGHTDEVDTVAFSPDGHVLASGSRDKTVKLWDVASGRLLNTLTGHSNYVIQVAFSPDGTRLVSVGDDEPSIKIWDVSTGMLLRTIETPTREVAYSPDGKLIATVGATSANIALWDAESGGLVRSLGEVGDGFFSVSLTSGPDNQWLSATSNTSGSETTGNWLRIWNAETGQVVKTLSTGREQLVAPSPDAQGRWLYVTKEKQTLKVRDANADQDIANLTLPGLEDDGLSAISPDSGLIVTSNYKNNTLRAWDLGTGKLMWTFARRPWELSSISPSFSPDGRWLASTVSHSADYKGSKPSAIQVWDVTAGRLAKTLPGNADLPNEITYSPDGHLFVGWSFNLAVFDAVSGRKLWAAPHNFKLGSSEKTYDIGRAAFSPDGKRVVATDEYTPDVTVWDAATGQLMRPLLGNPGTGHSILFLKSGKRVVVGNENGSSAVWDVDTGELLAKMFQSKSGEWITITPEGFFTASEEGSKLLYLVKGFEVTGIDQVYQSLYRPDLVQEKLAGDPDGKVKEAAANLDLDKVMASGAAPKVSILDPADKTAASGDEITVEASVSDQGGGVGKIEWRVNGTTLGLDQRGLSRVEDAVKGPANTSKRTLSLEPGDNHIEVVAYNGKNLIASEPARITVNWDGDTGATLPKLYVLSVGVNDYWDGRLKLTYAVPDANALADAFRQSGPGKLYESIEVKTVEDADVTVANLDKVFGALAQQVHARDTFVFFLAGHGKTVNGRYYFVPQDFHYEGEESIVKNGVDQDRLQAWFAQIPARRSVLLFDTCESGSLTGERVAQRGLERITALDRMTQAMGRTVLSASTEDAPALEGYHGHGVFTYVVLDGLGAADTNGDGTIEVTELASFVDQKVPELSFEAFKQRQVPQMKIVGSNFALSNKIAVLPAEDQAVGEGVPSKPSHVVIAPADVFATAGGKGTVVANLAPGNAVAVVKAEQGWVLVAKEGKLLGYVAQEDLAPLQ